MEYEEQQAPAQQTNQENVLLNLLHRYLAKWYWFALSLVLACILAILYTVYQAPLYEVKASILIKDDKKGAGLSELSAFEDLGILNTTNNIENEIEVLKSRQLTSQVARELRLNVSYVLEDRPVDQEIFGSTPVYLRFVEGDSSIAESEAVFEVKIKSNSDFEFTNEETGKSVQLKFGQEFESGIGKAILLATADLQAKKLVGRTIRISVQPINDVVDDYRAGLRIDPVNKSSNVINISLREKSRAKAVAIVDNLIKQHNLDAIADKNLVSKNTAEFINERIRYITSELSDVEQEVEAFKMKNKLVDVESEAKLFLQTGTESEVNIVEANTQKALADYMFDYIVKHDSPTDLMPANLGINDPSVAALIGEYNKLVLDRNRILHNSGERNPVVQNLDVQLSGIRKSVKESLNNYRSGLQIKIRELGRQEEEISSRIANVPKYERMYRMIQRQQQIKETLYLYLLQKREETNIALAVTVANAKVIDHAYSDGEPVWPKRKIIFLVAMLVGLGIPVLVLYIIDLLDTKVHGKRDIDRIGVPFIGDIPEAETKTRLVVTEAENSSVAEAFRLLRTNIDFLLGTAGGNGKTIFLTSTLSKEGKSFVAINLAASIAITKKKVLLIGLDIRAPKILQYMGIQEQKGITNFISDPALGFDEILLKSQFADSLDVLPSGNVPPNPAELLMHKRVEELFSIARERYDYVIVDTAPVGMVTDTLLLSHYADAIIYVVRAYSLDRRLLSVPQDLYREKRFPNMAVLINGTDKRKGYGYGYGYGYGGYGYHVESSRPWWRRIFS